MTKRQENEEFVKMLKEFPKIFGRVSFRERLMLRTAFTYVVEEVIADIKANCDFAIEGRDVKIKELENKIGGTTVVCTKTLRNLVNHYEELVQAKEIIKEFVSWAKDDTESPKFQEIVNQAEQFIGGTE